VLLLLGSAGHNPGPQSEDGTMLLPPVKRRRPMPTPAGHGTARSSRKRALSTEEEGVADHDKLGPSSTGTCAATT
jgi:hypothetical protein